MSGGAFDYDNYRINGIIERIEHEIEKSGRKKTDRELKDYSYGNTKEYYEKYPDELYHYKYSDEVITEFKNAVDILKKAYVYSNRVDYLLSGDDGEESFKERLKNDLDKL